jgi:hypothetical protein
MPTWNRRWLRVVVVLAIALGLLGWALSEHGQQLLIDNESGQTVAFLEITVAGKTTTFRNLPAGAVRTAPYRSRGDASFDLTGRLVDDTRIRLQGKLADNSQLVILPKGQVTIRPKGKSSLGG